MFFFLMRLRPPRSTLFPYPTLFRSRNERHGREGDIMSTVYMWSHVGTHVEAPLHFLADGGDTASIPIERLMGDRKSTRLNSSHANISYAVFCLKKKNTTTVHSLHIE